MANDASVTMKATVLPDEIAKIISGSLTVTPADATEKWYYKKTNVSNASSDLMAGYFTDYDGVDDDTQPTAIDPASDKVNFLFIKNLDTTNDIYFVIDAGTVTSSISDGIKVSAGNAVALELPNTLVGDIHAISSASTVDCVVAAIIDDI